MEIWVKKPGTFGTIKHSTEEYYQLTYIRKESILRQGKGAAQIILPKTFECKTL